MSYSQTIRLLHKKLGMGIPIGAFVQLLDPTKIGLESREQFYDPIAFSFHVAGPIYDPRGSVRMAVPVHGNSKWIKELKERIGHMVGLPAGQAAEIKTVDGRRIEDINAEELPHVGRLRLYSPEGERIILKSLPEVPIEYSLNKEASIREWYTLTVENKLPALLAKDMVGKQMHEVYQVAARPEKIASLVRESVKDWSEFVRVHNKQSPIRMRETDAAVIASNVTSAILQNVQKVIQAAAVPISQHISLIETRKYANTPQLGKHLEETVDADIGDPMKFFTKLVERAICTEPVRQAVQQAIYVGKCRWNDDDEDKVPKSKSKSLPFAPSGKPDFSSIDAFIKSRKITKADLDDAVTFTKGLSSGAFSVQDVLGELGALGFYNMNAPLIGLNFVERAAVKARSFRFLGNNMTPQEQRAFDILVLIAFGLGLKIPENPTLQSIVDLLKAYENSKKGNASGKKKKGPSVSNTPSPQYSVKEAIAWLERNDKFLNDKDLQGENVGILFAEMEKDFIASFKLGNVDAQDADRRQILREFRAKFEMTSKGKTAFDQAGFLLTYFNLKHHFLRVKETDLEDFNPKSLGLSNAKADAIINAILANARAEHLYRLDHGGLGTKEPAEYEFYRESREKMAKKKEDDARKAKADADAKGSIAKMTAEEAEDAKNKANAAEIEKKRLEDALKKKIDPKTKDELEKDLKKAKKAAEKAEKEAKEAKEKAEQAEKDKEKAEKEAAEKAKAEADAKAKASPENKRVPDKNFAFNESIEKFDVSGGRRLFKEIQNQIAFGQFDTVFTLLKSAFTEMFFNEATKKDAYLSGHDRGIIIGWLSAVTGNLETFKDPTPKYVPLGERNKLSLGGLIFRFKAGSEAGGGKMDPIPVQVVEFLRKLVDNVAEDSQSDSFNIFQFVSGFQPSAQDLNAAKVISADFEKMAEKSKESLLNILNIIIDTESTAADLEQTLRYLFLDEEIPNWDRSTILDWFSNVVGLSWNEPEYVDKDGTTVLQILEDGKFSGKKWPELPQNLLNLISDLTAAIVDAPESVDFSELLSDTKDVKKSQQRKKARKVQSPKKRAPAKAPAKAPKKAAPAAVVTLSPNLRKFGYDEIMKVWTDLPNGEKEKANKVWEDEDKDLDIASGRTIRLLLASYGYAYTDTKGSILTFLSNRTPDVDKMKEDLQEIARLEEANGFKWEPLKTNMASFHPYNALVHHTIEPVAGAYPTFYNVRHTKTDMSKDAAYAFDAQETLSAYHTMIGVPQCPAGVPMKIACGCKKSDTYEEEEEREDMKAPIEASASGRASLPPRPPLRYVGEEMPKESAEDDLKRDVKERLERTAMRRRAMSDDDEDYPYQNPIGAENPARKAPHVIPMGSELPTRPPLRYVGGELPARPPLRKAPPVIPMGSEIPTRPPLRFVGSELPARPPLRKASPILPASVADEMRQYLKPRSVKPATPARIEAPLDQFGMPMVRMDDI